MPGFAVRRLAAIGWFPIAESDGPMQADRSPLRSDLRSTFDTDAEPTFLMRLAQMPRSPLEELENLEQLRVLSAGHTILVATIDEPSPASIPRTIAADYAEFVARFRRKATTTPS